MPGPPPKPDGQRRRRNASVAMTQLPAAGREGPPLRWPYKGRPPALWAELCRLPQAVAWERMHMVRLAARYCRKLLEAEQPDAMVSLQAEVRQLEDRLGLSPMSMLRLRWEIAADEVGALRAERTEVLTPAPRRRLRAVDPGAVAGA